MSRRFEKDSPVRFLLIFLSLFALFYYFTVLIYGVTTPGNYYNAFLDTHFNYVRGLRHFLLWATRGILTSMGYTVITSDTELMAIGHGVIDLGFDCLGFAIMSFFTAFVIAFPKKLKSKIIFGVSGIILFQALNIIRFVLLAIFIKSSKGIILDHHTIFNIVIYIFIGVSLYIWIKHDDQKPAADAKPN